MDFLINSIISKAILRNHENFKISKDEFSYALTAGLALDFFLFGWYSCVVLFLLDTLFKIQLNHQVN